MATLLTESFEVSALGSFTTATGTPPVRDTSQLYEGVASLYVDATGAAKYNQLTIANRIIVARFYYRIKTDCSTTTQIFMGTCSAGDFQIQPRVGRKLRAAVGATGGADSAALNLDQWYLIDVKFDSSTGTGSTAYSIDGVAQTGASRAQTATDMAFLRLGVNGTPTYQAYFDAIKITDQAADYPLGAVVLPPLPRQSPYAQLLAH